MAAHSGSEVFQQFHGQGDLQDGNGRVYKSVVSDRGLGHFPGFHSSLPPHSNTQIFQKISPLRNRQYSLSISSSTYGPHKFSQNILESNQVHTRNSSEPRNSFIPIFGRLAGEGTFEGSSKETYRNSGRSSTEVGVQSQQREVRVNPFSSFHLSGLQIPSGSGISEAYRGEVGEDNVSDGSLPQLQPVDSQDLAIPDRPAVVDGEVGPSGSATCTSDTVSPVGRLVSCILKSRVINRSDTGGNERDKVVERKKTVLKGVPLTKLPAQYQVFTDASEYG